MGGEGRGEKGGGEGRGEERREGRGERGEYLELRGVEHLWRVTQLS